MKFLTRALTMSALAMMLLSCSEEDDGQPADESVDMLDPTREHYGKSYAEWAEAWVQWVNDTAPPECVNPILDETGADCALYQDQDSPVFFLAGNYGGVSIREECVVPAGKAIFLPVANATADNAGVPEDMLLPEEDLLAYVESTFDLIETESLRLSVDGHAISKLERGGIRSAPYTIRLEPDRNLYTCNDIDGVEGDFDGYQSGYWALLPPLEPGAHTIEFYAHADEALQGDEITIDVTFQLTVE